MRRRLASVLDSARTESESVERQIEAMTTRLSEMPVLARERAEEAADVLRRGLEGLNAAAMAAAEEAQEIDAAFQARIRQNYELLSDFMLRMGSVAGGRRVPDLGANELPDPLKRRAPAAPSGRTGTDKPTGDSAETAQPGAEAGTEPAPEGTDAEPDGDAGAGQPERRPRRGGSDAGWRWKDLLSSMPQDGDDGTPPSRKTRSGD